MVTFQDLPVETLSHAVSLLAPPFYFYAADPPSQYHPTLDPLPQVAYQPSVATQIARVSRANHALLEASRPWLWESVHVHGGRGWLAVVNALTEEVAEEGGEEEQQQQQEGREEDLTLKRTVSIQGKVSLAASSSSSSNGKETATATGNASTAETTSSFGLPPTSSSSSSILFNPSGPSGTSFASPLTSVPVLSPTWTSPLGSIKIEGLPAKAATKSILTPPSPILQPSKIRGRSRSPRRSIGFTDEGILAVLERSRSSSRSDAGALQRAPGLAWPRRPSFTAGRRTSLSNVNVRREEDGDDPDGDIATDQAMEVTDDPGSGGASLSRSSSRRVGFEEPRDGSADSVRILTPPRPEPPGLPPAEEEQWWNCNPELLPPPGPYIRHLSFVNFRTIGSRRTQDEAVRGRFVTGGRLEGVLKNAPNLVSLCMTEYVDSALSAEVIEELFFRGTKRPRKRRRLSSAHGTSLSRIRSVSLGPSVTSTTHDQLDPPRPIYVPYEDETEDQAWRRRGMFTPLEALDLTGCVSRAFQDGMRAFWEEHYAPDEEAVSEEDGNEDRERGRGRDRGRRRATSATEEETEDESHGGGGRKKRSSSSGLRAPIFPNFRRLSFRACSVIDSQILDSLLLSFTALTHLDLSNTKITSSYLSSLINKCPRSLRLQSLSLARCPRLDPYVMVEFLCVSPAAADLRELNLYVNPAQGNSMRPDDLLRLITTAPCFKSGKLRYLDLSSAMFKPEFLAKGTFPPQPSLVSLGLSHLPGLPLPPIATFLLELAPNVEILTLTGTAAETALRPSNTALQLTLELHARLINPLTTLPFSIADLTLNPPAGTKLNPGPSRLRVIELSSPIRDAIGPQGGSHEWKVIRSKGNRGWYVDVSAGWVESSMESEHGNGKEWTFARHLPNQHPWRKWLMSLNAANGRVSSAVGWHSRKMEIIRGYGMLGREEGLAGAGAFGFEE